MWFRVSNRLANDGIYLLPANKKQGLADLTTRPCYHKKTAGFFIGSSGGTRTPDRVVNSHLLYQLSYRGIERKFTRCREFSQQDFSRQPGKKRNERK